MDSPHSSIEHSGPALVENSPLLPPNENESLDASPDIEAECFEQIEEEMLSFVEPMPHPHPESIIKLQPTPHSLDESVTVARPIDFPIKLEQEVKTQSAHGGS